MRDDEEDSRDRVHTVDTVPPPAGEDDVYDAKTQIGGLTPEQLAMLRQVKDERPPAGLGFEEIVVPIFEDDARSPSDGSIRAAKIVPAAGRAASAKATTPTPQVTPSVPAVTPVAPVVTPLVPASKRPPVTLNDPRARDSDPALPQATTKAVAGKGGDTRAVGSKPVDASTALREETPPIAPVFAVVKADRDLAPLFDAEDQDAEQEPEPPSYVSVFAPISGDGVAPRAGASAPSAPRGRALVIFAALVVMALAAWLVVPRLLAH
jgi:hypothetical protein